MKVKVMKYEGFPMYKIYRVDMLNKSDILIDVSESNVRWVRGAIKEFEAAQTFLEKLYRQAEKHENEEDNCF